MDLICGSIVHENTIESYFEVFKEDFISLHLDGAIKSCRLEMTQNQVKST